MTLSMTFTANGKRKKWNFCRLSSAPCIRLARGKFELTNQDSAGGKKSSVLTSSKQSQERLRNQATFLTGNGIKYPRKGIYIFQKSYQFAESEKYELFCVSKLLVWRQKWVAGARHGNSLVVRRVSPGRIITVLFWTKFAVPRQIKPGIFKLTTSRGQSNL